MATLKGGEGRGATIVQIGTQTVHTVAQRHSWCCNQLNTESDNSCSVKNEKREKFKPCILSLFLCTPGQSLLDCWLGVIRIVRCSLPDIYRECVGGGGFTQCSTIQ